MLNYIIDYLLHFIHSIIQHIKKSFTNNNIICVWQPIIILMFLFCGFIIFIFITLVCTLIGLFNIQSISNILYIYKYLCGLNIIFIGLPIICYSVLLFFVKFIKIIYYSILLIITIILSLIILLIVSWITLFYNIIMFFILNPIDNIRQLFIFKVDEREFVPDLDLV